MKTINFDCNQIDRIKNLILLKGECLKLSKIHMENYANISSFKNFYLSMSDAIDVLLTSQINDELTNTYKNRDPLNSLLDGILIKLETAELREFFDYAHTDLTDVFTSRTDFLNGSHFLDFSISSYSVFEHWVSTIYASLFDEKSHKDKKIKLALKHLAKLHTITDTDEQKKQLENMISECSFFVSSAQKIQQVIKLAKKKNPKIDNVKMLEKIMFYGALRNTIHNLGLHEGKFSSAVSNIELAPQKPASTSDYSNFIQLCREIVYMYKEIIDSLGIKSSDCCINTEII